MTNRLTEATSPYLQQHADNPVDWWEWGEDAFAEAAERGAPVFLSVGYAACHWCHVMAHESFEDPQTAEILNAKFVSIKVDREERPDVDAYYMRATQALTRQGGWPMSVFLDEQARPFYAGTYFPPQPSHGRPSFTQVLLGIDDLWRQDRARITDAAVRTAAAIADPEADTTDTADAALAEGDVTASQPDSDTGQTTPDLTERFTQACDRAAAALGAQYDDLHAGFGSAPKFPAAMVLEFLLAHHARTGSDRAIEIVSETCEAMARGGMYDQLAGGFARYSVDNAWVVPHFEKMLYDNAQLLRLYLHWWRATGSSLGERIARETADFLIDELRTPEGGFASSLDADSTPVAPGQPAEGAFYVWNNDQLLATLGESDAAWAAETLTVTTAGTYEAGYSVLQLRADPDDRTRWQRVRAQLQETRSSRARPDRDDKVVAAWNGLAITALSEAGVLLDEPRYLAAASDAAELLLKKHRTPAPEAAQIADGPPEGAPDPELLRRVSRDGVVGQPPGVLEDYGDVASGLVSLYEATCDVDWLRRAEACVATAVERFRTVGGGFSDTDTTLAGLIPATTDPTDNAYPSGTSAVCHALISAGTLLGDQDMKATAARALGSLASGAEQQPRFFGWSLAAMEAVIAGPLAVAISSGTAADREILQREAYQGTSPGLVIACQSPSSADSAAVSQSYPGVLTDRPTTGPTATAYVCRDFLCLSPTSDPGELADQIR